MIPKDQEGQPKRPGGTFWRRGTLSRGSPQDAVLLLPPTNNNRASEKKRQTLRLAGAVFRFGKWRTASCRNFFEIAAAGTSAGGLRAAFPSFWVAPEAQRGWISPSAEGEEGRCPSTLPAFFKRLDRKLRATPHKLQSFRLAEVYQHILWITSAVLPAKAH